MKVKNTVRLIAILIVGGLILYGRFLNKSRSNSPAPYPTRKQSDDSENNDKKNFDRNPAFIHYSKHARCRMDCRHIDESEVKEILEKGEINYNKSELETSDCKRRFALEGISHDQQRLRVIFAPCNNEVTVVTCIDLEQEWACYCD